MSASNPASWPAMSMAQAEALLTAPGSPLETTTAVIRGVELAVWRAAPPDLRALADRSRAHGDRLLTVYEGDRVSHVATGRAAAALARTMQRMGVGKGDRVALAMRNLPEWPAIFLAAVSIGAIAVPLNAWWTGAELDYGLRDSGTKLLFADAERHARLVAHYPGLPDLAHVVVTRSDAEPAGAERLEAMIGAPSTWADLPDDPFPPVEIGPDDPAAIFYTSGTTGAPKGALGSHRNLLTNIFSSAFVAARTALRRGDPPPVPGPRTGLLVIPLFHVTACSATLMGALATGSTLVLMRRWDPLAAMALIERERVAVTGGVPTIAWQLLEHPERGRFDLSSLESIAYGGAPSAPELVRRIAGEFGAQPGNGWGMSETMATVTGIGAEDYLARPDSCGRPVATAELKIVGPETGRDLPAGEVGELWVRGPMVVHGYWRKPEATAEAFVQGGWLRTGDLARLDAEGFCFIVDRAKDVVIRGGENIYSSEVENALYEHPAVTDAAVIGRPHRTLGEEPVAIVHLAPGTTADEAELQDWVRARLAAFKTPVAIRFSAETLPRNANGKVLKRALATWFEEGA